MRTIMDRIVVGITGASGIPYGIRLLEVLKEFNVEVHLTCSPSASLVNDYEGDGKSWDEVLSLADVVHDNDNLAASISSGSFDTWYLLAQDPSGRLRERQEEKKAAS